tara:strand:- start:1664 stop:1879 length:216 start_codon:yes stop_codon:yes gene_type:complete
MKFSVSIAEEYSHDRLTPPPAPEMKADVFLLNPPTSRQNRSIAEEESDVSSNIITVEKKGKRPSDAYSTFF